MIFTTIFAFINLLLLLCISGGLVYLFILLVRALQKYLKSREYPQRYFCCPQIAGRSIERTPHPMPHDSGVCG